MRPSVDTHARLNEGFVTKLFLKALAAAAILSATAPAAAQPAAPKAMRVAVAPADEYFGKMKLSILGIRNQIHDLTLRIGFEPAKAESFIGMANMTEDAMKDWERKYPHDPWIPKTLFSLERMYSVVHWSNELNTRAKRVMTEIRYHYATSWYGKQATKELAKGGVGKFVPSPAPVAPPPAAAPVPSAAPPDAAPSLPPPPDTVRK
jgi:hypothetical protein